MKSSTINGSQFPKLSIITMSLAFCAVLASPLQADSSYGPVKSSDTLSKIIKRYYTGSKASQLQVMNQIVETNPNAFLNGNMNLLKLNASLILPGDNWKNFSLHSPIANTTLGKIESDFITLDLIDRSAPELSVEQMKGRIVFLDAERSSLIEEVAELKRETLRLEAKVTKLEAASKQSDEQLRLLDAEIIRLSALLKEQKAAPLESSLNQLVALQEKLRLVQNETDQLRNELKTTQGKLAENSHISQQADKTIAMLTKENSQLQKLLQDTQPGINFYQDVNTESQISILAGKLQLPKGVLVVAGAALSLMLITLLATRKKQKPKLVESNSKSSGVDPFETNDNSTYSYSSLLETDASSVEDRGYAQPHIQAEENVFKMFDEGGLEMDLKLDMAEAYLQVSDVDSARSILQEVIDGGSELQKRKAMRLIKKAA